MNDGRIIYCGIYKKKKEKINKKYRDNYFKNQKKTTIRKTLVVKL